jgi:hypothetical protein
MTMRYALGASALAAMLTFTIGAAGPAFAQAKKAAGASKQQACIAKARAENPDRAAGHARQAAYNRCMGR